MKCISQTKMFIRVQYGVEKEMDNVIEFKCLHFVTAWDVLEKVKELRYGNGCVLHLYNDKGRKLQVNYITEKARMYCVKRHPKWTKQKGPIF